MVWFKLYPWIRKSLDNGYSSMLLDSPIQNRPEIGKTRSLTDFWLISDGLYQGPLNRRSQFSPCSTGKQRTHLFKVWWTPPNMMEKSSFHNQKFGFFFILNLLHMTWMMHMIWGAIGGYRIKNIVIAPYLSTFVGRAHFDKLNSKTCHYHNEPLLQ